MGIVFLVLVVIVLLVLGVVGIGAIVRSRRTPGELLEETPKAELLGPGGPDDPDA